MNSVVRTKFSEGKTVMSSGSDEQTIFSNMYGVVTNKRVTYFARKNRISGSSREDIPLKQVVSVRYETGSNILYGVILIIGGLGLFEIFRIVGIILLVIGGLTLWGFPTVNVVTAGGTSNPSVGWPWERDEAEKFVSALRSQIFTEK